MNLKEAYEIVNKQLADFKNTSDNFESVFPGAVSAYRPLVEAYTIAVAAMQHMIDEHGEEDEH